MKKLILALTLIIIAFMSVGCNFGGQPTPEREIKLFVEDGGAAAMNQVNFYTGSIEISAGSIMFIHKTHMRGLNSVLYIDGVPQVAQLDVSAEFSNPDENTCYHLTEVQPRINGLGTYATLWWDNPGKGRFKAAYEEDYSEITVFCFDSATASLDGWSGIKILSQYERTGEAVTKEECFIYKEVPNHLLPGKSYMITTAIEGENYLEKLYNIRSVDFDKLNAGITDRVVNAVDERFYICENHGPAGGYVKLYVKLNSNYVWDWSADGNFRE